MTRQDILNEYEVCNGVITSSGKFEGEAIYVPYFYDAYLNGDNCEDEDGNLIFDVEPSERVEFPELGDRTTITLHTTDDGFVCEV